MERFRIPRMVFRGMLALILPVLLVNVVRSRQSNSEGDKVGFRTTADPVMLKFGGCDNEHSSRRLAEEDDCSQQSWPKRERKAGIVSR